MGVRWARSGYACSIGKCGRRDPGETGTPSDEPASERGTTNISDRLMNMKNLHTIYLYFLDPFSFLYIRGQASTGHSSKNRELNHLKK